MSASYFVRYQGQAAEPNAFLDYYRDQHAALLKRFPGIEGLTLHTPIDCNDPFPTSPGGVALLAQMTFASPADLNAALQSSARAAARDDFRNFPEFDGQVFHQAMRGEKIF